MDVSYLFFASAVVTGTLAALLMVRPRETGEPFLAASLAAAGWWALCVGAGWPMPVWAGVLTVVPFLATYVALATRPGMRLTPGLLIGIWAVPLGCLALAYVPPLQPWFFDTIGPVHRPAYLVFLLQSYVCMAWVSWRLVRIGSFRVLAAILVPLSVDVLNRLWPGFVGLATPTPLAFAVTGVLLFLLVYRFRYQPVSPIARSFLFEKSADALVVLDNHQRVVDVNEAARALGFGTDRAPDLSPRTEVTLPGPDGKFRYYESSATLLTDPNGTQLGTLVQVHDIHNRRLAVLEERLLRETAEALGDVALTMTAVPETSLVLDKVADHLFHLFGGTASLILECGEQGRLTLGSARGRHHPLLAQWLADGTLSWTRTPSFQTILATGRPLVVSNTADQPGWVNLDPEIRSWAAAPIQIQGTTMGFLRVDHDVPGYFTEAHGQRLQTFADLTAVVIQNAQLFRRNTDLATRDPLTGLWNRREFFARAEAEIERSRRYGTALALVMVDLDRFKEINDTHGHLEGDRILKAAAEAFRAQSREADQVARFGGDEFCILLPQTDLDGAWETGQRIWSALGRLGIEASLGIAALGIDQKGVEDLLHAADLALYRAKAQGRNQVSV